MSLLKKLVRWLLDSWFSVLLTVIVVAAAAGAVSVGLAVPVPKPIPDFALQARPVYRALVGGVWFAVVYLVIMAVALAIDGRGFVKFGSRGIEPGQLLKKRRARKKNSRSIRRLQGGLKTVSGSLAVLKAGLKSLAAKHDNLEQELNETQDEQDARIEELEERQRKSSEIVAELEKRERVLKERVLALEKRIDSL